MLAFFMMVAPLSLQAAEETTEEFAVSFEQEYALPGETLSLDITGADVEDCTITWVKNGAVVAELANQTSYTLQDGDLQNLYEVFVSTDEGEVSTKMLISKLPVVYIDIENGEEIENDITP